jgi:DNA mismatch repair protein MutL
MQKIKRLSTVEAQKIAAGEVIERPANVVKELIENSLDAGATMIVVHANDGGKSVIRVTDNGCGMNSEDARICFERHTTSKLHTFDELAQLTTFGFRGEALASIAAIGNVTLVTKEEHTAAGTLLHLSAGTIVSAEEVACNTGTDIIINDLFFQMPARKKFLKADQTEARHITQLIHAFCLNYPMVHFMLYTNGEQQINCAPTQTVKERCAQLWDMQVSNALLACEAVRDKPHITVSGIISNQQVWKYDRTTMFIFVNKRWVRNQKLGSAVLKGFSNALPAGKFPIASLSITIDEQEVDINVHPRKEEVSFTHPRIVEQLIEQAVKRALEKQVTTSSPYIASSKITEARMADSAVMPFGYASKISKPFFTAAPSLQVKHLGVDDKNNIPMAVENVPMNATMLYDVPLSLVAADYGTVIGQFNKTYLLVQKEAELQLIDQHAAHERILYEQFVNRFNGLESVQLLFPTMVPVTPADMRLLDEHLTILLDNGICAEPFGDDNILIQAVPVHIKHISLVELVHQFISWIKEELRSAHADLFKSINEKLRAQMACKAAIKAGDELTIAHMQELLQQLYKTENRFSCPHGRPTTWSLPLIDIERKFRRK